MTEVPNRDVTDVLRASTDLKLRPNSTSELYLWVLNPNAGDPAKDRQEFTVEMQVARGGPTARTKVTIPAQTWVRVRLPKPAPPAAPATPAPAAPAAPATGTPDAKAPANAPEPPPPGVELPLRDSSSTLTFRLLDKNGEEVLDTTGNGKPYGGDYRVTLRPLSDYVSAPDLTITPSDRDVRLAATVKQKPFAYPGNVPVRLLFPPQDGLAAALLREGFYRRTLTIDTSKDLKENSVTLSARIENPGQRFRVYVGIDGIDRAYGYTLNLLGTTPKTQILPETEPAVRVSRVSPKTVTAPVAGYPVLVEVDNPGDGDSLEVRLRPVGAPPNSPRSSSWTRCATTASGSISPGRQTADSSSRRARATGSSLSTCPTCRARSRCTVSCAAREAMSKSRTSRSSSRLMARRPSRSRSSASPRRSRRASLSRSRRP